MPNVALDNSRCRRRRDGIGCKSHIRRKGVRPGRAAGRTRKPAGRSVRAGVARGGLTLVIYMGVARCGEIQRALLDAGMAADTPAAVVSQACTPRQRHASCRLATLADTVRDAALPSPAVLVLGDVVRGLGAVQPQASGLHAAPAAA